jgi:hypothetical protein
MTYAPYLILTRLRIRYFNGIYDVQCSNLNLFNTTTFVLNFINEYVILLYFSQQVSIMSRQSSVCTLFLTQERLYTPL